MRAVSLALFVSLTGTIVACENDADQRPEEWVAHYLLAELQVRTDPAVARNEIRLALELNPLDPNIRELAGQLGVPLAP